MNEIKRSDENWIALNKKYEAILTIIQSNQNNLAALNVKAGIFGLLGGALPAMSMLALTWLKVVR